MFFQTTPQSILPHLYIVLHELIIEWHVFQGTKLHTIRIFQQEPGHLHFCIRDTRCTATTILFPNLFAVLYSVFNVHYDKDTSAKNASNPNIVFLIPAPVLPIRSIRRSLSESENLSRCHKYFTGFFVYFNVNTVLKPLFYLQLKAKHLHTKVKLVCMHVILQCSMVT